MHIRVVPWIVACLLIALGAGVTAPAAEPKDSKEESKPAADVKSQEQKSESQAGATDRREPLKSPRAAQRPTRTPTGQTSRTKTTTPTPTVRPGKGCAAVVTLSWNVSSVKGASDARWEIKSGTDFTSAGGEDPKRAASGSGPARGSATIDLRKYGSVLDSTPWYLRVVAKSQQDDVALHSKSVRFQRSVELPASSISVTPDPAAPLKLQLAVKSLPKEIADCADSLSWEVKKGSTFTRADGPERGSVASGRIAGTSGKTSIDLGRSGAGDYYVRVGALSNKQGVGLRAVRSAVQRVTLADPSPAQTVAPRLAKAPVERPAAKLKPAPAPKDGEPSDPPKAPEPTASPKTSEPTRSAGTLGVALRTPGAIRPLGLGSCMAEVSFRWDVTSLLPQAARVRWELKRDSDFQNRTGPEPGRLASEVGTPSGFVTLDLREFGPVMNGTPYYFRLVAQDANGNDLAERSDSARIDTDVTDTNFQVARSPDDPFRVTLSWDLHPPLARCSDRVFYEVKKDTPFQNLTGREDTRLIGDDRAGTQGSVQLDLSAGPGNYYFRLAGKSGGGGEEADVGRRGAGVPVPFPTTAPTVELAINGGLSITHQDLVDLVIGIPLPPGLPDAQTRWRASESESNLASQQWRGFASPTRFRLSEGDATKTVFVQVQHGAVGHNATTALQSPVESDSIVLSLARAPKIELNLDSGASSTTDRGVSLSHVLTDPGNGVPSSFRASEDADLTDVAWRPYETAPAFVLSEGNSGKRVFMQVRSVVGEGLAATNVESPIASDTIALVAAATVGVSNEQPAPPREVSVGVSAVTKLVDYSFTGGTQAGAGATASLSQYIRALQNAGIAVGNLECAIIQGQREIKLVDGTPRRQPGGFFSFLAPRPPELVSPGCMFRLGPLPNAAFDILVIDAEEDPNSSPVNFITVNRESDPPPRVELIHTDDVPGNVLLRRIVIRGPAGADWGDAFRP